MYPIIVVRVSSGSPAWPAKRKNFQNIEWNIHARINRRYTLWFTGWLATKCFSFNHVFHQQTTLSGCSTSQWKQWRPEGRQRCSAPSIMLKNRYKWEMIRPGTRLFNNWRLIEYLKEATRSARLGTRSVLGAAGKVEIWIILTSNGVKNVNIKLPLSLSSSYSILQT